MSVSSVNSSSSSTASSLTGSSSTMGKDDFLQLLITQMKNQDPLNPMDSSDYASQLAQFSTLEAVENLNDTAETQLVLTQSLNNSYYTQLIGKEVKAESSDISLEDSQANVNYNLGADADSVTVQICDEAGNTVRTFTYGSQSSGDQTIAWNGRDNNGNAVADGTYTVKITASADGTSVSADSWITGLVSGITYSNGSAMLQVGDLEVDISSVISVDDSSEEG